MTETRRPRLPLGIQLVTSNFTISNAANPLPLPPKFAIN
jgi:hypothetical protein